MKTLPLAILMLVVFGSQSWTQELPPTSPGPFNRNGRVSLALHGGGNMWFNDFDTRKVSGAGDLTLRYAISRQFSLGLVAGYDALQSVNTDNVKAGHPALQYTYVVTKGFTGDVVAWYHFNAGQKVSPYVYLGIGTYTFKRKVNGNRSWPDNKDYESFHVPVGFGVEFAVSKNLAISTNLGARIIDNLSDNWAAGSGAGKNLLGTDWYPTARIGLNFYFGSSVDDDNDADGLLNGFEKKLGTDPILMDTDADSLSDYDEVVKYLTSPTKADSDSDAVSDGDEVLTLHTDPLKPDTDGDGLSDGDERNKYKTDPLKADTDGDGLSDSDEINKYKTLPLTPDTDGDGVNDGDEVNRWRTNPLRADTDGGSISDGDEVARGSNPLDRTDDVVKKEEIKVEAGKAIVLDGIVFDAGKSKIKPAAEQALELAYNTLAQNAGITVEIRGYTDNVGKKSSNTTLSEARANAVRDWLVKKGIDAGRVSAKGYGPADPIGDNKTAAGRQMNRRIEFYRMK